MKYIVTAIFAASLIIPASAAFACDGEKEETTTTAKTEPEQKPVMRGKTTKGKKKATKADDKQKEKSEPVPTA